MVAAIHGAHTVATDQAAMVRLLARNADGNLTAGAERARFVARQLVWGSDADLAALDRRHFDIVLVSDCISPLYGDESWAALAATVKAVSHASSRLFFGYQFRGSDAGARSMLDAFFGHLEGFYEPRLVAGNDEDKMFIFECARCAAAGAASSKPNLVSSVVPRAACNRKKGTTTAIERGRREVCGAASGAEDVKAFFSGLLPSMD
jgi:hypothetical protein